LPLLVLRLSAAGAAVAFIELVGLAQPDCAEHEDGPGELADAECLVEDDPAGQGGNKRAEETKDADLGDGEELDATEPEAVGDSGADGGEPYKADEVRCRERVRESFDADREWQQNETAGNELPRGEREEWNGTSPSFGEDDADGHGNGAREASENADGVELRIGTKHEKGDADNAETARDEGDTPEMFVQ
jgi:hypothetical protein